MYSILQKVVKLS